MFKNILSYIVKQSKNDIILVTLVILHFLNNIHVYFSKIMSSHVLENIIDCSRVHE